MFIDLDKNSYEQPNVGSGRILRRLTEDQVI